MSEERRYDRVEIEKIFEAAATESATGGHPPSGDRGLTLSELQEIGREVGIAPARVARAARDLDWGDDPGRRWSLPLTVSRMVALPRKPTEDEWEALVSDLRATFRASGTVRRDGGLMGWTNGNLHAFVEPTGSGYRLRMGTTKGSARRLLAGGGTLVGIAALVAMLAVLGDQGSVESAETLAMIGAALMGVGAVRLPGWARKRRRQMEEIGERAQARLAAVDEEGE